MLNRICLIGRVTADIELRMTTTGTAVTSFTLAVERNFKQSGEKQTDFINCVAWRKTAEFISQYVSKGSLIAIDGELQTRAYEDKNGNKRKAVEVVVQNVSFCESKASQRNATPATEPVADFETVEDSDDLPF